MKPIEVKEKQNLFGEAAGTVRRVEDFIVKHREVECKTKPDRVSGS